MAFRFNLESVLKHRSRLEDTAQREFVEAQRNVTEILARIEKMYQRGDEVREEIAAAQADGSPAKLEQVRVLEAFLIAHRRLIENARLEARRLMALAEEKQDALIVAAREKKILVKLKERRQAEYREWLNRLEAKELDDITMVRQTWRRK